MKRKGSRKAAKGKVGRMDTCIHTYIYTHTHTYTMTWKLLLIIQYYMCRETMPSECLFVLILSLKSNKKHTAGVASELQCCIAYPKQKQERAPLLVSSTASSNQKRGHFSTDSHGSSRPFKSYQTAS